MKKKTKRVFLVILAVIVALCAAFFYFFPVGLYIHTLKVSTDEVVVAVMSGLMTPYISKITDSILFSKPSLMASLIR